MEMRGARSWTRAARSSNVASKAASEPSRTGSGTDQCIRPRPPSSSWAESQTVITQSSATSTWSTARGLRARRATPWRAAVAIAPGSMAAAGCVPADATGTALHRCQRAVANWERAELPVHTKTTRRTPMVGDGSRSANAVGVRWRYVRRRSASERVRASMPASSSEFK